jgi:hypothetical protein
MIKIDNRNEGCIWVNHNHIVSLGKFQVHTNLFVTRIRMFDGSVFHALEDCETILNRIENSKRKEREAIHDKNH